MSSEADSVRAATEAFGAERRGPRLVRDLLPTVSLLGFLLLLFLAFSVARPEQFPTVENAQAILAQQALPALIALAATLVLMSGEFDISLGATLGITAVFTAWMFERGLPVGVTVVLALSLGLVVGLVNVVFVVLLGIDSFIATLAVSTVLAGFSALITGGETLFEGIPSGFTAAADDAVGGIPLLAVYVLIVAALLWYLSDLAPFGRRLRATGQGRDAAGLIGVRTGHYVAAALIAGAGIAAVAGVLYTASAGSASPTVGPAYILPAYAAAFLGAATGRPPRFNVWGTVIAVLILSVGTSGLTMIGAPFWATDVFNGTALAVALVVSRLSGRSSAR